MAHASISDSITDAKSMTDVRWNAGCIHGFYFIKMGEWD